MIVGKTEAIPYLVFILFNIKILEIMVWFIHKARLITHNLLMLVPVHCLVFIITKWILLY